MASNEKIVLGVAVDASSVKPALDGISNDARAMADKVIAAGKAGGGGLEGMGVSAAKTEKQIKRELDSITKQVQRVQVDMVTAGRSASEALQIKAYIKGIDVATLKPQIDALKALEMAQGGASSSMQKTGMSANAMSAAMRNVPAQMTDIVVSLQGGQKPMTVLLQQGGQLKDMFGGVGNAAKALGGYVLGMVNPFTIAAAGIAAFGFAMTKANSSLSESNGIAVQLAATGRGADMTREQFSALTKELTLLPGVSKDASKAILGEFVKTREIGGALFRELGMSVADFAAATGVTAPEAAKTLAKAFADPAKGAKELEAALGSLTSGQMLTIEALEKVGDKAGAQRILMDALKESVKGLANDAMTPLGREVDGLGNAWGTMLTKVGNSSALNTANNIFASMIGNVAALVRKLSELKLPTWLQSSFSGGLNGMVFDALGGKGSGRGASGSWGDKQTGATGSFAPAANATDDQVKNVLELTKSYKSQAGAMADVRAQGDLVRKSLTALRAEGKGNSIQAKELEDRLAGVNEKLTTMGKRAAGSAAKKPKEASIAGESEVASIRAKVIETQRYIDTMKAQGLEAAKQTEGEKLVVKIQQELEGSLKGVARANKEKALSAAMALAAMQKEKGALEALLKAQQDFEKARDKEVSGQEATILKMEEKAQAMEDQVRMYGLSKEAIEELTAARERERVSIVGGFKSSEEEVSRIERRINASKRLAVASDAKDGLDAGVAAAKKADAEWKKTATSIENTLTDSLMRAFEGGKGFAQAMRDTIVNMFKTMVLRPIVSAVMTPVSAAIGGALSLPGAASAATGGGSGGLSMLSSLGSLASGSGILGAGGLGLQAGFGALINGGLSGVSAALSGGMAAIGAGTGAGIAAGLGTIAGALGPIGLGLGVVMSLMGGKKDVRFGSQGSFSAAGTQSNGGPNGAGDDYGGVSAANRATAASIDAILERVGSKERLRYLAGGFESSEKGKGFSYAGGILSNGKTFGQGTDGLGYQNNRGSTTPEQAVAEYQKELAQATLQALQAATDIPKGIRDVLASLDIEALSADGIKQVTATIDFQIQQADGVRQAFAAMGLAEFAALGFDAALSIANLSGGLEAFKGNLASYYDTYTSEADKTANITRQVTEALAAVNIAMPTTRDEFKAQVEQQLALGEAGAPAVAALLQVNQAFASIVPAAAGAAGAVSNAAAQMAQAAAQMQAKLSSVVSDYLSNDELRNFRAGEIKSQLQGGGIDVSIEQILSASRDDARAMYEQFAAQGNTSAQSAILDAAKTFADLTSQQQQPASGGGGGGGGSAAGFSVGGAGSGLEAWKSATDAIVSTMKDLRQTLIGSGSNSLAELQAQFAIASAQAKAGSLDAAQSLPGLAKSLVDVGKDYSASALDQALLTARTIEMLGSVVQATTGQAAPGFSASPAYAMPDAPVTVPQAYNPAAAAPSSSASNAGLLQEIRALREELAGLRASSEQTAANTRKTATTLDDAAVGVRPLTTIAA